MLCKTADRYRFVYVTLFGYQGLHAGKDYIKQWKEKIQTLLHTEIKSQYELGICYTFLSDRDCSLTLVWQR